jgi:hypothetical protein
MEIQSVPLNLVVNGQATPELVSFLNVVRNFVQSAEGYGTTAQRPLDPRLGQLYYDTTLAAEVVCSVVRAGAVPATWKLV